VDGELCRCWEYSISALLIYTWSSSVCWVHHHGL
jgi:hypothetical protein